MSSYSDAYIADMKVKEIKAEKEKALSDTLNIAKKQRMQTPLRRISKGVTNDLRKTE